MKKIQVKMNIFIHLHVYTLYTTEIYVDEIRGSHTAESVQ